MDTLTTAQRSARMALIKSRNTKPERLVRSILTEMGFRYRLDVRTLPGKPDIVIRRLGAAIFVHGCFWHQHTGCKTAHIPKTRTPYWRDKLKRNVVRDEIALQNLTQLGWSVITVWECELRNPPAVRERLEHFLGV